MTEIVTALNRIQFELNCIVVILFFMLIVVALKNFGGNNKDG